MNISRGGRKKLFFRKGDTNLSPFSLFPLIFEKQIEILELESVATFSRPDQWDQMARLFAQNLNLATY